MLDMPLRRAPLAILDWETTWSPDAQYPVSVALLHCNLGIAGSEELVTHELINPGVPIRHEATAIHGITDEMVALADPVEAILGRLLDGLKGRILCSYNLPFDWKILRDCLTKAQLSNECPVFGFIDPLIWAKTADKFQKSKKLKDVCGRRGITGKAHDAAADTLMTAQVAPLLLRDLKAKNMVDAKTLDSVGAMWEWTKKEALAHEVDFGDYCYRNNRPIPTREWHPLLGVAFKSKSNQVGHSALGS